MEYCTAEFSSSLWSFPDILSGNLAEIPELFYSALRNVVSDSGTIIVNTGSTNLCNTSIIFDPDLTPSSRRGAFCECVRNLTESMRSFHPFNSYSGVGPNATYILDNVSRNSFGPETPESRLIDLDADVVMLGLTPHKCSTIHQIEHAVGSPYRYMKEFLHPVKRENKVVTEPYYFHVNYRNMRNVGDGHQKFVSGLTRKMTFDSTNLDGAPVYRFKIRDYFNHGVQLFLADPYIWFLEKPSFRPYRT